MNEQLKKLLEVQGVTEETVNLLDEYHQGELKAIQNAYQEYYEPEPMQNPNAEKEAFHKLSYNEMEEMFQNDRATYDKLTK